LEAEHIFLGLLLETKLHGKTSNITTEDWGYVQAKN
jgi:hypothetical protein